MTVINVNYLDFSRYIVIIGSVMAVLSVFKFFLVDFLLNFHFRYRLRQIVDKD